jgi:hypothetical protein
VWQEPSDEALKEISKRGVVFLSVVAVALSPLGVLI